jgi:hypothetical protein
MYFRIQPHIEATGIWFLRGLAFIHQHKISDILSPTQPGPLSIHQWNVPGR